MDAQQVGGQTRAHSELAEGEPVGATESETVTFEVARRRIKRGELASVSASEAQEQRQRQQEAEVGATSGPDEMHGAPKVLATVSLSVGDDSTLGPAEEAAKSCGLAAQRSVLFTLEGACFYYCSLISCLSFIICLSPLLLFFLLLFRKTEVFRFVPI